MLSPLFALALLGLSPASGGASEHDQETVLIIARPETSEYYLPQRQQLSGTQLLERNPELVRTEGSGTSYRLSQMMNIGGEFLLRAPPSPPVSTVPEPSIVLLFPLTAFLLLRRRRPWHRE